MLDIIYAINFQRVCRSLNMFNCVLRFTPIGSRRIENLLERRGRIQNCQETCERNEQSKENGRFLHASNMYWMECKSITELHCTFTFRSSYPDNLKLESFHNTGWRFCESSPLQLSAEPTITITLAKKFEYLLFFLVRRFHSPKFCHVSYILDYE